MRLFIAFVFINLIYQGTMAEFIKFDYGSEQIYSLDNGIMSNSESTYVVNFQGAFENIPQIIFTDTIYSLSRDQIPNSNIDFSFTLQNVTTKDFTLILESPSNNGSYYAQFEWTAIDDQRIEVINVFNKTITNVGNQNLIYPHKNRNALQGFITLTSFGFQQEAITINLQIENITADSVIVNLNTLNTPLLSIGYQIVLGTSEAFSLTAINEFESQGFINKVDNMMNMGLTKHLTPVSGFSYPNFYIYHEDFQKITAQTTVSNEMYIWSLFFQNIQIQTVMINQQISQSFLPFMHGKMRVTKKKNQKKEMLKKMIIQELNQEFTEPRDSKIISIDNQVSELNIIVSFQCQDGKQILGKILKCLACDDEYLTLKENCYGGADQINFNVKLTQQDKVNQQLEVKVNKQGFEITQPVINQVIEVYVIAQFEIIN